MNGLEIVAIVATCAWLGVLTAVTLALVRQVGIVTIRLSRSSPSVDLGQDGPVLGSPIPAEVAASLPEIAGGVVYVLMTSATCAPCRAVVSGLAERALPERVVALVAGPGEAAHELESMLPSSVRALRDPTATSIARSLDLHSAPFALELEFGVVTGKAFLHDVDDLMRLIKARSSGLRRLPGLETERTERKEVATSAAK